ncbi:acyltransferase [Puia sp.]|jgi:peptidoglycan/LPS O-acetylase OafA/YrhL|uniref:acyltransferase family protein n=1 Tax=Puia sp. TaxID=2045100 RepID=UPI002F40397B
MKGTYLKGLNTLRFFAAFFVIISHWQISMNKLGDYRFEKWAVFQRGGEAVEFFFTLSGFLITYLLQKEIVRTSTVSIKEFYIRRVFRIWPLYFLLVLIGFVGFGILLPKFTGQRLFEFPLMTGALLFIFFLPNLASALYPTALLHPLWSIGVEEQYYLFWAPLAKLFRNNIIRLIGVFLTLTCIWYVIVYYRIFAFPDYLRSFFLFQKFYAMAMGGLFGWILFAKAPAYRRSLWALPWMQWLVFGIIVWYFLTGIPGQPVNENPFLHIGMSALYGLLILNSSMLENPAINLEKQPFVYLGTISYGLYMYHMLVDYFIRFTCIKFRLVSRFGIAKLAPTYLVFLLAGTVLVSSLSYKYLESYFLRLKDRHAK